MRVERSWIYREVDLGKRTFFEDVLQIFHM